MNKGLKGMSTLAVGILALSLTACPGGSNPAGNGISGPITAPENQVLNGVIVAACFNNDCSSANSKQTTVNGGHTANYQIPGLTPGQYIMVAVKDVNGSGKLDVGDWLGTHGPFNNPTPVTSPASNVDVQMGIITATNGLRAQFGVTPETIQTLIRQPMP